MCNAGTLNRKQLKLNGFLRGIRETDPKNPCYFVSTMWVILHSLHGLAYTKNYILKKNKFKMNRERVEIDLDSIDWSIYKFITTMQPYLFVATGRDQFLSSLEI